MDQDHIEQLLRRYQDAANAGDAKRLASLYTSAAILQPGDMQTSVGVDAVEGFYAFAFSMLSIDIEFEIAKENIVVHGDHAYATTSSTGTRLIKASNETVPENNRELWVFERGRDASWKIARYMFNKSDTMR